MPIPRRPRGGWRPWESPSNEELTRRPLCSCKRLCFENKALENNQGPASVIPSNETKEPIEVCLNEDTLDDSTQLLLYGESPSLPVSVIDNPMVGVSKSKHGFGVLKMIGLCWNVMRSSALL